MASSCFRSHRSVTREGNWGQPSSCFRAKFESVSIETQASVKTRFMMADSRNPSETRVVRGGRGEEGARGRSAGGGEKTRLEDLNRGDFQQLATGIHRPYSVLLISLSFP